MPQENPRNESQRSDSSRNGSSRSEHFRSAKAGVVNAQFAEIGVKSLTAGLRMQRELFETFRTSAATGSRARPRRPSSRSSCRGS